MIKKQLHTVAVIVAGQSPESSTYNTTGDGLPFFQGKADFQEKYPQVRIWCNSKKRKEAEPGDILMSVRAPVGSVNICNQKSIIGRGLSAIRPLSTLNNEYLYYFLKSNEQKIATLGTGSTFKAITQETLRKIEIPLPALDDQIRIAHLLSKVEGLIAQRKKNLQQLDDLLKSVFMEMFGDPVRNEKGWDQDRIGKSTKVQGGFAFKSKDLPSKGTVRLVKIANVNFEVLVWDDISYVPDHYYEEYKRFILHEGDLLIALTRPVIKSLDVVKTATVRRCDLPSMLNQRVARFICDSSINKRFLLQYCYTSFFKATVDKLCPPGLQPNISTGQIEDITIYYPPIELQNHFAAIADKVECIKSHYQQSLAELENLYGALSQKAFKGELDLSRVDLPTDVMDEVTPVAPVISEAEPKPAMHLPAPEDKYSLFDAEGRLVVFGQWLDSYLEQLGGNSFFAENFMECAQQRLWELLGDDAYKLSVVEYDHIKGLAFKALESGRLSQSFDDDRNMVKVFRQRFDER